MKVLSGHLDWGLATKDPHSDAAEFFFLGGVCVLSAMFLSGETFC